jgi:hypothetical protein
LLLALILFRPSGISGGEELTLITAPKGVMPKTASAAAAQTLQGDSNAVM